MTASSTVLVVLTCTIATLLAITAALEATLVAKQTIPADHCSQREFVAPSCPEPTEHVTKATRCSKLDRGQCRQEADATRCSGNLRKPLPATESGFLSPDIVIYKVTLSCNVSTSLNIKYLTFLPWVCPQMGESVKLLDEVVTNWNFKSFSYLQENDSLILTRSANLLASEPLMLHCQFKINFTTMNIIHTANISLRYNLFSDLNEQMYHGFMNLNQADSTQVKQLRHKKWKRATPVTASGYLIVANQLYLHHISLDGSRTKVAVSDLDYAVVVDYLFRNGSVYWTDYRNRSIMTSTLDGLKKSTLLDHGLTQPGGLSVDWISNKIYWADVRERTIGVMDLVRKIYKLSLILTDSMDVTPRGLVVDPTTRMLYWTELGADFGRIMKASMDGSSNMTLFSDNLRWPYAITIDLDAQVLYWVDSYYDKIECGNVNGTGRRLVVNSGLDEPFDITLLGDILYISDQTLGILALNKSGGLPVKRVYNTFCDRINPFGIEVIAQERQLLMSDPCNNDNGGCSHLCLLSSTDSRGYSCLCPEEMTLDEGGLVCTHASQMNTTSPSRTIIIDSCSEAGYTNCCTSGMCQISGAGCFCDPECYHYGDCCSDIEYTCLPLNESNSFILASSVFYIHRMNFDGTRMTVLHSSGASIKAVDYNYRNNRIYWSTSNGDGLWQLQFDGSQAIPIHTDDIQSVGDIAVDWITNKVYWTDDGQLDRICLLDIPTGHHTTVIYTGHNSSPRALIVDPIRRWMYWSDWRNGVAKIEKASMDGQNRSIIHDTNLVGPSGLTLDYATQILYWTDQREGRIESSAVDGSNRSTVRSQGVYQPFGISVYESTLYFTDLLNGINTINSEGVLNNIFNDNKICEDALGIEVVNTARQPTGANPCQNNNGGCSHLCLLSSIQTSGYSCACPDGQSLSSDGQMCLSDGTAPPVTESPLVGEGTCAAAGYTGGCCTSGTCRGSPPTCSCDSTCHLFRDCCSDVHPSCQPDIDVLEFVSVPSNVTIVLGHPASQQRQIQFYCSVRASRVTTFEWTFTNTSQFSGMPHQINQTHEDGSFGAKYLVLSTEYSSSLIIEDVEFSDAGIYTCTASIGSRIGDIEASAYVDIEVFPKVPEITGNHMFTDNETINLLCRVESYPQPSIVWLFRSSTTTRVILTTSRISISQTEFHIENGRPYSSYALVVDEVNTKDNGDYLCTVNAAMDTGSSRHSTTVQTSAHTVTIATTNPCEQPHMPCLNGATCINNSGKYYCVCTSTYEGPNCSQRVQSPSRSTKPRFLSSPESVVTIEIGAPLNLSYTAQGHPTPSFEWYKDDVLLPGEFQPFLYIAEVLPEDRGNYSCKAINNEGVTQSSQIQINITGVLQYVVVLECNGSVDVEENFAYLFNPLFSVGDSSVYSVEYLTTESNDSNLTQSLLVTLLARERTACNSECKTALSSKLGGICEVHFVIRFDGCEMADNTEIELGENIKIQCPCHEYLEMIPQVKGQVGQQFCSGSYKNGAHLSNVDFSQCTSVINATTQSLCDAIKTLSDNPLESVLLVINITKNHQLSSIADIMLLSLIIEFLTEDATRNPMITNHYLKVIDYFQLSDPHMLRYCQILTNSSTRVLSSLEQFASMFNVDRPTRTDNAVTTYSYQSFGIVLVDISVRRFLGQTVTVYRRKQVSSNATEWNSSVVVENGSGNTTVTDFVARIYLSWQIFKDCNTNYFSDSSTQRIAYFVFHTSILFQSAREEQNIGTTVTAVRLNCSVNELTVSTPISITYKPSTNEKISDQICSSWMEGVWTKLRCKGSRETDRGLIRCDCYQLSYFGLLIEHQPAAISVATYTYVSVVFSFMCLVLVMISIIATRSFVNIEGVVISHMILMRMLRYFFFLLGAHAISLPVLCGLSSGLIHLFTLVFFCWAALHSLTLCFNLLTFCGLSRPSKQKSVAKFSMALSWVLPILIVIVTAGTWSHNYGNSYFCGVVDWPLWIGLALPLGIICVIHFTANALLVGKIISIICTNDTSRSNSDYRHSQQCIVIINVTLIVFYTELLFELLSVNLHFNDHSNYIQVALAALTFTEGPLLFVYVLCSLSKVTAFWYHKVHTLFGTFSKIRIRNQDTRSFPTTDTNFTTTSMSSTMKKVDERKRCKDNFIETETNQAYETVISIRKKDEKAKHFDMTDNHIYGQISGSPIYSEIPV